MLMTPGSSVEEPHEVGKDYADLKDERGEARLTILLRTAKLIADGREYLCLVRDVSATGTKLQLFHPLPQADSYRLELEENIVFDLNPVWSEGNFIGFRFAQRCNLGRLFRNREVSYPKRQIRLKAPLQGIVQQDATEEIDISFENISQQGACIQCSKWFALDQRIIVHLKGFPPITARVRWRNRPLYGLVFEQTFRYEELANRLFLNLSGEHAQTR